MQCRIRNLCFLLLAVQFSTHLCAENQEPVAQYQEIELIQKTIEDFIYDQSVGLPGQIQAEIGKIDRHITLPMCENLQPFMPQGSRLWGKTSVGVRCDEQVAWTIYVQAEVKVLANVLHAAQLISRDQTISFDDVTLQTADLTKLPEGVLTEHGQAVGKIAATNLSPGQPVRQNMLRAPYVILRGQNVKLMVNGRGFSVSSEGHALSDAAEGQIVQVRNPSGRVISGLARQDAIVEITP